MSGMGKMKERDRKGEEKKRTERESKCTFKCDQAKDL